MKLMKPNPRRSLWLAYGLSCLVTLTVQAAIPPRYDHVVVVIEENRALTQIIGDLANAPYINSLAAGGVQLGRMFAIEHPSQPNYLQLYSGSNQGVLDDELPPNFSVTATATYPFRTLNLGAEIIAAGFSFASYSEELETAGAGNWADYDPHAPTVPLGITYRRKHNPCANWVGKVSPLPANQLPGTVNKAFSQFPVDFTQLPHVSLVVPNQKNDMHDGSRKEGDTWLQTNLNGYAQWAKTHNSLLIITWDEDDYNGTNQIATVLYGSGLRPGGTVVGGTWTLHNLLRTLEDMYGSATHAGSAAQTKSFVGPFAVDPDVTVRTIRQGLNSYASGADTMLSQDSPAVNNAATHDLVVDLDLGAAAGNQVGQVLVRFDALVGAGANQVPANATIHSAKLILSTPANGASDNFDSNDTFRLHRMMINWADTATWDSLTAGVSNNDVEAASATTFSLVPDVDGGPAIFDVTSDVELLLAGTANYGWVVRPSSTGSGDGWTLKSNETTSDESLRPTLEIIFSVPSVATPYSTWASAKGLTAANAANALDPDRDGLTNLIEFAFNLNPLSPDSRLVLPGGTTGLPNVALAPVAGGRSLEISFLRRKGVSGISYTAQFATNFVGWTPGLAPSVVSVDADWERVTVRDAAGVTEARRFARVLIAVP
jgi:phosphatidylinositol-3-phosphatase